MRGLPTHPCLKENEELFKSFDQLKNIENYDFVSFDTELTGLSVRRDEIVSIGAVRIRGLRIVAGDNFFSYIQPTRELPKDSTLVHRITPEQIRRAPDAAEILPKFVEYCSDSLLIGHYVLLDMAFLNKALLKNLGGKMRNPSLDSVKVAATLYHQKGKDYRARGMKGQGTFNLNKLAVEHGLPLFEQHDALEDALQTAYLFLFLVKSLREAGYVTLKDFTLAGRTIPNVF